MLVREILESLLVKYRSESERHCLSPESTLFLATDRWQNPDRHFAEVR